MTVSSITETQLLMFLTQIGMTHNQLQHVRHGKEFFKCTVAEAVHAIQLNAAKFALIEIKNNSGVKPIQSPSDLFKDLLANERFANSALKPDIERLFLGLEIAYRYIEAVDFNLAEEYFALISDKMSYLTRCDVSGSGVYREASECALKAINAASILLAKDCEVRFFANISAYRLFVELRLIGYWDLAGRVYREMAEIGGRDSIDGMLFNVRKEWSEKSPVSVYCVLNQFALDGGDFALSHPGIVMDLPVYDLFDGVEELHPKGWHRSTIRENSPLIGVPRWTGDEILLKSDSVLLPKGYISIDESVDYGKNFACWADFSAWGGKRIAYHTLTHALQHIFQQVRRDNWPAWEGVDGYLFDDVGKKVGCLNRVLPPLIHYLTLKGDSCPCRLSKDGLYTLRRSSGAELEFRIDYWASI